MIVYFLRKHSIFFSVYQKNLHEKRNKLALNLSEFLNKILKKFAPCLLNKTLLPFWPVLFEN